MIFFLDASALVKHYHEETGTDTVHALLEDSTRTGAFFISDHTSLEVIVRLNKLRRSSGRRERRRLRFAVDLFLSDRARHLTVLPVEPDLISTAETFASTFAVRSGAGTLDLIHLVSAMRVQRNIPHQPLVFVASDRQLKHVASSAGLLTFDPEHERTDDLATKQA